MQSRSEYRAVGGAVQYYRSPLCVALSWGLGVDRDGDVEEQHGGLHGE